MCTAKSQGGQRCYSSASQALTTAHAAKGSAARAFFDAIKDPRATRETLLRRMLTAHHAYEDALAQYASTKRGRADLEQRLNDPSAAPTTAPPIFFDASAIKTALSEGQMLAERAAETKRAVRAGEMTQDTARTRAQYPNDFAREQRAQKIETTVARILNMKRTSERGAAPNAGAPAPQPPQHPKIQHIEFDAESAKTRFKYVHITVGTSLDEVAATGLRVGDGRHFKTREGRSNPPHIYVTNIDSIPGWIKELRKQGNYPTATVFSVVGVKTDSLPRWAFNRILNGTPHGSQGEIRMETLPAQYVEYLGDLHG